MNKWIKIALWSFFVIGVVVLLTIVRTIQNERILEKPEIIVEKIGEDPFLTEPELLQKLKMEGLFTEGMRRDQLDLEAIESFVKGISQVKSVKVYTEIGNHWQIKIKLKRPVARVFNKYGESFYLDEEGGIMETTPSHTARSIIVSGEIFDRIDGESVPDIINNDSLISIRKLDDIYRISSYVCYDPLFRSLIGQIYLDKNGDFILVPLVGDQKIVFGKANSESEVKAKFEKLRTFYQEGMPYVGWDTYSEIKLQYDGQIVCKRKPTTE
jgi:cell division protein FtsQ